MAFIKSAKHVGEGYSCNLRTSEVVLKWNDMPRLLDEDERKRLQCIDMRNTIIEVIRADETQEKEDVSTMYHWFKAVSEYHRPRGTAKFACKRSLLVDIAAPKPFKSLFVICIKHKGMIFLFEANLTEKPKPYFYIKKAVKKLLIKPQNTDNNNNQPTGSKYSNRAVVRVEMGYNTSFKVLISFKVNALDQNGQFVQIKLNQWPSDEYTKVVDLRWWLQSHLVGMRRKIVGVTARTTLMYTVERDPMNYENSDEGRVVLKRIDGFLEYVQYLMRYKKNTTWLHMKRYYGQEKWLAERLDYPRQRDPFRKCIPKELF
ncbi:hypothetical protein M3Y95_00356400 [Aphelenchoides besseyi]|nr:hypothetical protein M3Y95_00356400 [Aphelenchoides besseyi]